MLNRESKRETTDCFAASEFDHRVQFYRDGRVPFVYSGQYDFAALEGAEVSYGLDPHKRSRIFERLSASLGVNQDHIFCPEQVRECDLKLVHSRQYLSYVASSSLNAAKVMGIKGLEHFSVAELRTRVLRPIWYAVGGTLLACDLAHYYGWAINLSGGFHHAAPNKGEGFCFISDIAVAAVKQIRARSGSKVLIVDLDAHQGNGLRASLGKVGGISIFDVYNKDVYPRCKERVNQYDYPLPGTVSDHAYMELLHSELPKVLDEVEPTLLIYNAGSDVWCEDRLGGMQLSRSTVLDRDEFVFRQGFLRRTPIVMVLAGGYSSHSHELVADSICNLRFKLMC
ncbi:MAG: histone deacetylase [Deltaproteobacteria bacterium]|nr:histone deacetylase [Deltaproteobacteria bacterium]